MKLMQQCLGAAAIALLLPACSQEAPWGSGDGNGEGAISLRLYAKGDITSALPDVRAISTEIVTPPVADFKVKVSKIDGSYSQTFTTVEDFVNKESFSVGTYEIEAWYGDPDSQGFVGDGEGYENSYYYGITTDITVVEGQTTNVELSASLANSIILLEYTDAFKSYFKDWNTTLQSAGKTPVSLGSAEGSSYVTPGDVKVTISAELHNGNRISLSPASFNVEAGHMYKMRYNIFNGEVGGVDQLVIEFDENLNSKPVYIDLSKELENTPAPKITAEGFVDGQNFTTQSGTPFDGVIKFNVSAAGKIGSAVLTVVSDTYKPSFLTNGTIDICAATDAQKAAMEADGIRALGFYRNPGEMAELDLTELCRKLPDGEHSFSFQVSDLLTQVNEPVSVNIACIPLNMTMKGEPAPFGEGYADMVVSYNGPDPTAPSSNPFHFSVNGNFGYSDAEIISITKKADTRAYESHDYIYRIKVPDMDKDVFNVRAFFGEETEKGPDMSADVPFSYPSYKVVIDPMSRKLRIKVDEADSKKEELFFHKLKVFVNGNRLAENDKDNFLRDEPTDQLIVYNLEPSTDNNIKTYNIKTTLYSDANTTVFGSDDDVVTSPEYPVPNGNFSQTAVTINESGVQVGGQYRVSPANYTIKCNFNYSEPTGGWASVNQRTFYKNANPKNSWFTVASTYKDGNDVVIRTVGYNHNGTVPANSGGAFNTTYYCTNSPSDEDLNYCSGELFLGRYSFTGTESRTYGVDFAGRPTSFQFDYQYSPDHESSRGSAEIIIYATDGSTVLVRRKVYLDSETKTTQTITFPRYPFNIRDGKLYNVEAGKLVIRFLSSDPDEGDERGGEVYIQHIPTGGELNQGLSLGNHTISQNDVKAVAVGSVLRVSNLRFNYGEKQNR